MGIVYLDPTRTVESCDSTSTITTTNTGCKKFYIFVEDAENNTYSMIMDRNTTGKVAWNSDNTNTVQNQVKTALETDTNGWIETKRLISADEIVSIINKNNWSSSTATSSDFFYFDSKNTVRYSSQNNDEKAIQRSYHWLFDYTDGCANNGCVTGNSSTTGYWTSSAVYDSNNLVWEVGSEGSMRAATANIAGSYGVRPVITLDKALLANS